MGGCIEPARPPVISVPRASDLLHRKEKNKEKPKTLLVTVSLVETICYDKIRETVSIRIVFLTVPGAFQTSVVPRYDVARSPVLLSRCHRDPKGSVQHCPSALHREVF